MSRGYFITGTGTGVGKTLVSCALLHAFAARGNTVIGMKPVAAGCENGKWMDVELLATASNVTAPREQVNPYALIPPIAPHIAANQAGIDIDIDILIDVGIEVRIRFPQLHPAQRGLIRLVQVLEAFRVVLGARGFQLRRIRALDGARVRVAG